MTREAFHRWAEAQPRGRFERVGGEVVAMAPERWIHASVKARIWRALDREITDRGLPCQAAPDGMTVEVGDDTDYEPDALVNCGPPMADDATVAPSPIVIVIVEVLSPSTASIDASGKLADYFLVPSVQHYLLVRPARREFIHHRRLGDGIETRVLRDGVVVLDPPGIELILEEVFGG